MTTRIVVSVLALLGALLPVRSAGADPAEYGTIVSVSCRGTQFCMAVGSKSSTAAIARHYGLSYRFDGTAWHEVAVPAPPAGFEFAWSFPAGRLSVSCGAVTDCWAVGLVQRFNGSVDDTFVFAMHWDGASWRYAGIDRPGGVRDIAVACAAAGQCVAAGTDSRGAATWILRGGTFRSIAPAPRPFPVTSLHGVSCVSTLNCNAVGSQTRYGWPLIEHWDGTRWTAFANVPAPNPNQGSGTSLTDVSCPVPGACVALGDGGRHLTGGYPVVENRNNFGPWTVATPLGNAYDPSGGGDVAAAVSCLSFQTCGGLAQTFDERENLGATLLLWRDEHTGRFVSGPAPGYLLDVSCTAGTCIWAGASADFAQVPVVYRGTGLHPVAMTLPAPSPTP